MFRRASLSALHLLVALAACGVTRPWELTPAPVTGAPERFLPDSTTAIQPGSFTGCHTRLHDPGGHTLLVLIRSTVRESGVYWGDYSVRPANSYGLENDQLLRINCSTGHALGAVRGARPIEPRKT